MMKPVSSLHASKLAALHHHAVTVQETSLLFYLPVRGSIEGSNLQPEAYSLQSPMRYPRAASYRAPKPSVTG